MTNALGAKPVIDTKDFKSGIAQMNRDLRVLESGFRANAASMGEWAKDATGLELRMKTLNDKIDIQKKKVQAVREEYERVAKEKGENSVAAQNLEIKLNRETETLGKMERELKDTNNALEEMRSDSESAAKGVDKLDDEQKQAARSSLTLKGALASLGTGIKSVATATVAAVKALVAMAAAVAALIVGMAALTVGPASDLEETISKTGVVFGSAAEQVLAFGSTSAEALGLSENAALSAASTYGNLLRAMGLSENASADMSISLVKLAADLASFNNLDPTEVLDKLRAGLTGEAEPLKTLGVNMNQARIETKALELGLIAQGEELSAAAKAQAAYAIIMEDTALAQGDFARTSGGLANQQRILKAQFEDVKAEIGGALLPIVTKLITALNEFLQSDEAQEGIAKLTGFLGGLGDSLGNVLAGLSGGNFNIGELIGNLFGGFVARPANIVNLGLDIVTGLISGITEGLTELIPVALEILNKLVEFITQSLPVLIQAGIPLLLTLVDGILRALPVIVQAALEIIVALANGIAQALPTLIPAVIETLLIIVQTLIENLPLIVDAALLLILALVDGLIAALPLLTDQGILGQLMPALLAALGKIIPAIGKAGWELMKALAAGLISLIKPEVLSFVTKFLEETLTRFALISIKVFNIGKDFVDNIWQGIKAQAAWFYDQVKDFFLGIINAVKKAIGLPVTESFVVEGALIVEKLGEGALAELEKVERQLQLAFGGLTLSPALAGISTRAAGNYNTQNESFQFFGPVIVQGETPAGSLGATLKGRRF